MIATLLDAGLEPFAFGARRGLDQLHPSPFGAPLRMLRADDPEQLHMHHSAFIGFVRPACEVPERLKWEMGLSGEEAFVPLAEAISIPTIQPGVWTSYSMCTVLSGMKLGYASKLLSLRAYGARSTLSVAQFNKFGLKIHTRFGALELTQPFVPYHTCPDNTFVYKLNL